MTIFTIAATLFALTSIVFAVITLVFATYTVTIDGDRKATFCGVKRWRQYHRDCGSKRTTYRLVKISL